MILAHQNPQTVLFWGRSDPDYSRTRVVRRVFADLGWQERVFRPHVSPLGDVEATLARFSQPSLVWVTCFRQREIRAACRWARRRRVPVVFDALISAYDKQVFEKGKFPEDSAKARRLREWEHELLALPDAVVVDTEPHSEFFHDVLRVPREKLCVVPVGAEESLFRAGPSAASGQVEALFYGSFIGLQGPEVIIEAAISCPGVRWTLLGDGPYRSRCEELAAGHEHIRFEQPVAYARLAERIHQADVLLGIFGSSQKASRVIPNKVYQSLACGRPVVTRDSFAYPVEMRELPPAESGVVFIPAGDPGSLAAAVRGLASGKSLPDMGDAARGTYERWLSPAVVRVALERLLSNCVG